jgi:hypothetical protein
MTTFFVHKRIISVVRRVQFVSGRMLYIIIRGYWCNIIVLNVHASSEDKSSDLKDSFYEELYLIGFLGWVISMAKVDRRYFKPAVGNESSCEISNDNGVRVVIFATFKNLVVRSTMFPCCGIHKYTWTSPEGKMHNHVDHVLIDGRCLIFQRDCLWYRPLFGSCRSWGETGSEQTSC